MLGVASRSRNCGLVDKSEPLFSISAVIALIHLIVSLKAGTFILVSFGFIILTELVAIQRVRSLGQAKKIAESIVDFTEQNNVLQGENDKLKREVFGLKEQNDRLKIAADRLEDTEKQLKNDLIFSRDTSERLNHDVEDLHKTEKLLQSNVEELHGLTEKQKENIEGYQVVLGLFGDKVGDIDETSKQLLELADKYKYQTDRQKFQTDRQESNNIIALFFLIDRNNDGSLSEDELWKMNNIIKTTYGESHDFSNLDRNQDGRISLQEFIEDFKNRGD